MEYIKLLLLIFAIFFTINCANGYNILCAFPSISRSHLIAVEYLMKGLAAKGHNITIINQYPLQKPLQNYREVILPPNKYHNALMAEITKETGSVMQLFVTMPKLLEYIIADCEFLLQNEQVQKIMAEETFDLVIVETMLGNSLAGLATHFNCPLIFFSSLKTPNEILDLGGAPLAISYVPYYMAEYTEVITFRDRLQNMMYLVLDHLIFRGCSAKYHKIIYERYFRPPKFPSYDDAVRNASLFFVTHHFSQGSVRPLTPNIIEVSGLQITGESPSLPVDLQNWMNDSKNGVIFFSMGTNMKSDSMPPTILDAILKTFANLTQNILWKFDKLDIPKLPKNVRIENWLPQIDILQHNNLKLFITHGGLGSVTEAKLYGVPLLLIPIFADQMGNAKTVVNQGWGISFEFATLTEKLFSESITEVLNNQKYRDQAKYAAMLFRDRPLSPMQTAVYWVEYVIRYKGATHMRSSVHNLNFIQLHSLDVLGFLGTIALVLASIIYSLVRFLFRKVVSGKIKNE